ncbi:CoA transferase [Blastomonas sp. AAP53]|uniref:CaiB/BaiF CoA transferase family protein n=1 Tax=Blastomonas sp. AAP53 TaxID=1248760 RepID=UPI0002D75D4D|nr:CoA transferase [Blastomonas sp. AAP53]
MRLPLTGYRVLSAEQYGAGPYGTMFLAQMGAEVIKIEPPSKPGQPGGDTARAVGPHFLRENESLYFQSFNLNKKSLTLDLQSERGREILRTLAASSHAMVNNLRGDLPARLGLDYAALADINPAIVCAHLSAYGRDNERAKWPGYDYLMQAEAGFLSLTGEPDGLPVRFGLSIVDFMTGTQMAVGLLAAMLDAQRSGIGCDIDVDLMSVAAHQMTYPAVWYLNEGDVTPRAPRSAHPSVTPSQMFRSADGWMFVMAQLPKFWSILVDAIGQGQLKGDPRFKTPADRLANRDTLTQVLDTVFGTQPTQHWVDLLSGKVPVAPVHDLASAMDSPYLVETGMMQTVAHPDREHLRVLASPIRVDGQRLPARAGPLLGADNDGVLADIGLSEAEIADLKRDGII